MSRNGYPTPGETSRVIDRFYSVPLSTFEQVRRLVDAGEHEATALAVRAPDVDLLEGAPMDPAAAPAEPLRTVPGIPFAHAGNRVVIVGPPGADARRCSRPPCSTLAAWACGNSAAASALGDHGAIRFADGAGLSH